MSDLVIRPYRPGDREEVRRICFETGFMGEPASWYWRDATSFADIWTSYYTDVEPESAFVVDDSGSLSGYLLGCVDTKVAVSPQKTIARQILKRRLLVRPGTARFIWRSMADTIRTRQVPTGEIHDSRYPSHLHIDLRPAVRGHGVGRRLMDAWFERLRAVGSPGCYLATLAENTNGIAFFRSVGFEFFGPPQLVPGMRLRDGGRMHQQLMVRNVGA